MGPGSHGTTFGGNPLAMSVGNAVLDVLFKKNFLTNVRKNGKYFHSQLKLLQQTYPNIIEEIRGVGLLIGMKLRVNQSKFIENLMKNKLLTVKAAENVVRILPPLNVKKSEIDQAVTIINKVCKTFK